MKKRIIGSIIALSVLCSQHILFAQQAPENTPKTALSLLVPTQQETKKSTTVLSVMFEEIGELQELESRLSKIEVSLTYEQDTPTQSEITKKELENEKNALLEEQRNLQTNYEMLQTQIQEKEAALKALLVPRSQEETEEQKQIREEQQRIQKEKLETEKNALQKNQNQNQTTEREINNKIIQLDKRIEAAKQAIPNQKEEKETTIQNLITEKETLTQAVAKQRRLIRQQIADLLSGIVVLLFFVVGIFVVRWISMRLIQGLKMPLSRKATLSHIVKVTYNVIIGLIITGIVFSQFTNVIPFILLLGTGLAFAVRDSISSFIGWFIIGSESGYHINDVITLGDTYGRVKEINLLTTVLLQLDKHGETGKQISIPNKFIFEQALINHSRSYGLSRIMMALEMNWGEDIEAAENELMKALDTTINNLIEEAEFSHQSYKNKLERGNLHPQVSVDDNNKKIILTLVCFFPIELQFRAKQSIIRHFNRWLKSQKSNQTEAK